MRDPESIQVIKCGGSVLGSENDIARTCATLAGRAEEGQSLVIVVSAPAGVTDALYESVPLEASTSGDEIAEHVSAGERLMAARLTEELRLLGVRAASRSVHDIGLRASGPPLDADPIALNAPALLEALQDFQLIVLPGFAGVGSSGARRLLGRGGSDLTAVFVAAELGGPCTLMQDAPGIFESDPNGLSDCPPRFASMHWDDLLDLDHEVVQAKAVRLAKQRRLPFTVCGPDLRDGTLVGDSLAVRLTERPRHASS